MKDYQIALYGSSVMFIITIDIKIIIPNGYFEEIFTGGFIFNNGTIDGISILIIRFLVWSVIFYILAKYHRYIKNSI